VGKVTTADRDVLSVCEAADFMNVSPNSLRKALSQGQIASFRLNGRILILRRALMDFIERSTAR
jgi:excisionase family DNA binding protein